MYDFIWLASYPRSGNTLVRMILNDCFDLNPTSIYDEHPEELQALTPKRSAAGPRVVKTHETPADEQPAIYVVRDGRAAIVSHWHYIADFFEPVPMQQVIRGKAGFASWSDHFRQWSPTTRPSTLLLRYEDCLADIGAVVDALAAFTGLQPTRCFDRDFGELQQMDPRYFRSGSNRKNIEELQADDLALFDELHGPLMTELDYYR